KIQLIEASSNITTQIGYEAIAEDGQKGAMYDTTINYNFTVRFPGENLIKKFENNKLLYDIQIIPSQ
ncbi:hypothetical protein, partial [Acinetobacter baumannii]|uniref:hypothetical protein n=1 Tax=Acinetobacter baumannii TaxID=470 RepID=UPI000AD87692